MHIIPYNKCVYSPCIHNIMIFTLSQTLVSSKEVIDVGTRENQNN